VLETLPYAEMMAFQAAKQVKRLNLLWSHFFTGVFFMFFVFGFIKYLILGRDKAYLYYSLMGFFCALITIAQAEDPPLEFPWFDNLRGVEFFDLLRTTAFIMQGLFILEILHLKIRYPRITKAIKWYFLIHFLLSTTITIVFFKRLYFQRLMDIDVYDHFLLLLLLLSWVVYLSTIRKGFYRFIFLGALTILIAYTMQFAVAFFNLYHLLPAWFNTDSRASTWRFMTVALVLDMCFYFTGLAYRDRQVEKDKSLFQEQLNLQKLESEKTKAELQQQATELEMQALRAQMNPHFIFNSLNSINHFILQNNKLQASEYLTKFSRLVRSILQNSQAALIPLDSELEALKLYLELESLRFDHHFDYTISIEEDIDSSVLKVPPLIIQPYAENAIWHGLMQKKEKGHLTIGVVHKEDALLFTITDDGIGRKKAAERKSKSASLHKSMGMQITASRIAMLQQQKQDSSIVINDLVLPDGSPGGTEVIIKIPVCYD
jgi:sensor histidine kinase YesM